MAKSVDTIVIMMGLSRIDVICKQLIAGGMDKKTPVAVIQNGTTPKQKMIKGTVTNIAKKVKENKITPPTNIIIGNVVRFVRFYRLEIMLDGKTIAITRSKDDASEFISLVEENKANPIPLPTIELVSKGEKIVDEFLNLIESESP